MKTTRPDDEIRRPHRIQLLRHVEPVHIGEALRPAALVVVGILILIALIGWFGL